MYLFIGLYMVYGVVVGLSNSVRHLVSDAPPVLDGTLSAFHWLPLVAVIAAPLVEAVHIPYVGRRKVMVLYNQLMRCGAVRCHVAPRDNATHRTPPSANEPLAGIR